jgi:hypothetical protein
MEACIPLLPRLAWFSLYAASPDHFEHTEILDRDVLSDHKLLCNRFEAAINHSGDDSLCQAILSDYRLD